MLSFKSLSLNFFIFFSGFCYLNVEQNKKKIPVETNFKPITEGRIVLFYGFYFPESKGTVWYDHFNTKKNFRLYEKKNIIYCKFLFFVSLCSIESIYNSPPPSLIILIVNHSIVCKHFVAGRHHKKKNSTKHILLFEKI